MDIKTIDALLNKINESATHEGNARTGRAISQGPARLQDYLVS